MFRNKFLNLILLLSVVFVLGSCRGYQKLLKSSDYEQKYNKAIEYYEDKDYFKAQGLLEELRTIYRGTDKSEKIAYYFANCAYGLGEYSLSAYLLKDFVRQYPSSEHREDALFTAAYCYYLISPAPSLEQTYTEIAISEFQLFIERFPNSEKRQEAEEYIDLLQFRLETKAYNNAMLYYKIGDYKAANVALKNVIIDFPDTKYREDILFTLIKANFLLAENSIHEKRYERYKNTIDSYYNFIDNYPDSKKIKEAEKYYTNSLKYIEKKHGL
ncbi:MAG: outer membrane protein assembly factor BamD [Bacteroidales bacterium]|jgi:outer membrane protein assembly factor BamD|nr:outer membrane protein assembly factor BamD [Bacteroidales bacterium]